MSARSIPATVTVSAALLVSLGACASGDADDFCGAAEAYRQTLEDSGDTLTREQAAEAFERVSQTMHEVTAPEGLAADWDAVTATATDVATALSSDGPGDETSLLLDDDYLTSFAAVSDYVETSCPEAGS